MLPDLENFISDPNQADLQRCGDRCFDERLFEAAELIFKRIGNQQKLAQVYVKMKQFPAAFEAAKKANFLKFGKLSASLVLELKSSELQVFVAFISLFFLITWRNLLTSMRSLATLMNLCSCSSKV